MNEVKSYISKNRYFFYFLFIFTCSLFFFPKMFSFLEMPFTPRDKPPWYFIIVDLKLALGSLLGFLICSILILKNHSKSPHRTKDYLFFTLLWFGLYIGQGVVIFLNTSNILDPSQASTTWIDNEAYQDNFWNRIGLYVYFFFLFIVYWLLKRKNAISEK